MIDDVYDVSGFGEFLNRLGSTSPAPGGGAAAGITLSLGAACAEKAVRFSVGDDLDRFLDVFCGIRDKGLKYTHEDQEAFVNWQNARKLPNSTDEEKVKRKELVLKYSSKCAEVPMLIGIDAIQTSNAISDFLPLCNKWLVSDLAVGLAHIGAAFESSVFNIMVNLPYIKNEILINQLKTFMNDQVDSFYHHKEMTLRKCKELL